MRPNFYHQIRFTSAISIYDYLRKPQLKIIFSTCSFLSKTSVEIHDIWSEYPSCRVSPWLELRHRSSFSLMPCTLSRSLFRAVLLLLLTINVAACCSLASGRARIATIRRCSSIPCLCPPASYLTAPRCARCSLCATCRHRLQYHAVVVVPRCHLLRRPPKFVEAPSDVPRLRVVILSSCSPTSLAKIPAIEAAMHIT